MWIISRNQNQRHDQAVKRKGLSENEDQDQSDENPFLLRVGPNPRVSHDPDRIPRSLNSHKFTMQLKPQTSPEAMCENALLKV